MIGNIIDYVKEYGHISLAEAPLNDVDSLVLCQFAYIKFDGIVPGPMENKRSVSMQEVYAHADYEKLYGDVRFEKDNRALFEAMLQSARFGNMRMNCYINIIETQWETQFSAITFLMEDGTLFIAYRGTDESIIGWKEDFNMSFLAEIPAQSYSVKYLNIVTGFLNKKFYVGGHSKGGNLAIYAAMNCSDVVRERIIKVYSMDGPGFRPEVLERCDFGAIEERTVKIMPHSALVGMIFETGMEYQVVDCKGFGVAQHNPYTWLVQDGHFKIVEEITEYRKFMDATMNEFILSLDEQQLRTVTETIYNIVMASETDNLIDFMADWKKSVTGIVNAVKEVDPTVKEAIKALAKELSILMRERMKASFFEKTAGKQITVNEDEEA